MKGKVDKRHDLFLCHSHKDKRFVRRLANDLETLAIRAWFDEWELNPGDSLHGSIGTALEASGYVGVVLSPDSVESAWCKKEFRQALSREDREGRSIVIPIRYRRCPIPPFLEDKFYVDFSQSYFMGLSRLAVHLLGHSIRMFARAIQANKPKCMEDVKDVISNVSKYRDITLPKDVWDRIRSFLDKEGFQVRSSSAKIFPHVGSGQLTWEEERALATLVNSVGKTKAKKNASDELGITERNSANNGDKEGSEGT